MDRQEWGDTVRDAYNTFILESGAETEEEKRAVVESLRDEISARLPDDSEVRYQTAPQAMDACEKQLLAVVCVYPLVFLITDYNLGHELQYFLEHPCLRRHCVRRLELGCAP